MNVKYFALACAACGLALSPSVAQQTLRLNVLDEYGRISLAKPALACFDPVAALRFDSDVKAGAVSNETEQAFAVGSCLTLESGTQLVDAERAMVEDQIFVRGTVAGEVMAYIPEWAASLDGADDGYDADRAEIANSVFDVAQELQDRIETTKKCAADKKDLNKRIGDHNERVAAQADSEEAPIPGSRIAGSGGAAPATQIFLPSPKHRELLRQARALEEEAVSLTERCAAYRDYPALDRDYIAYYGVGS